MVEDLISRHVWGDQALYALYIARNSTGRDKGVTTIISSRVNPQRSRIIDVQVMKPESIAHL